MYNIAVCVCVRVFYTYTSVWVRIHTFVTRTSVFALSQFARFRVVNTAMRVERRVFAPFLFGMHDAKTQTHRYYQTL